MTGLVYQNLILASGGLMATDADIYLASTKHKVDISYASATLVKTEKTGELKTYFFGLIRRRRRKMLLSFVFTN
jgi:hypothetical protein